MESIQNHDKKRSQQVKNPKKNDNLKSIVTKIEEQMSKIPKLLEDKKASGQSFQSETKRSDTNKILSATNIKKFEKGHILLSPFFQHATR